MMLGYFTDAGALAATLDEAGTLCIWYPFDQAQPEGSGKWVEYGVELRHELGPKRGPGRS